MCFLAWLLLLIILDGLRKSDLMRSDTFGSHGRLRDVFVVANRPGPNFIKLASTKTCLANNRIT